MLMSSTPASHRQAAPWALLALLIAYATIHRLGRTCGSTSHGRRVRMPGDDIVPRPQFVITHAITIEAPAAAVWHGWFRWAGIAAAGIPLVGSTNSCFRQTEQARITSSRSFKIFRLARDMLRGIRRRAERLDRTT